jgi:hypothetical protein
MSSEFRPLVLFAERYAGTDTATLRGSFLTIFKIFRELLIPSLSAHPFVFLFGFQARLVPQKMFVVCIEYLIYLVISALRLGG